ncbi:MAG: ATP-binding protein, partial [Chloroflexi bacterium]|nr:ATP-binding protein [Chloroflexota bacterium]
ADNGSGMDPALAAQAADPFVTTRTTRRVGLGLPFLKQAAEQCGGSLTIESTPGKGTRVEATFQASHIDRMPLGDLPATILALVVGYPATDFVYRHAVDGKVLEFDTRPVKAELGGMSLSEPAVIAYLKQALVETAA